MSLITISKIYRDAKTDSKGGRYQLVNIYAGKQKYTHFDYSGDVARLQEGDTLDLSGFIQKPNEYMGKTSIVLSRPKKTTHEPFQVTTEIPGGLEARVARLEAIVAKMPISGQSFSAPKMNPNGTYAPGQAPDFTPDDVPPDDEYVL